MSPYELPYEKPFHMKKNLVDLNLSCQKIKSLWSSNASKATFSDVILRCLDIEYHPISLKSLITLVDQKARILHFWHVIYGPHERSEKLNVHWIEPPISESKFQSYQKCMILTFGEVGVFKVFFLTWIFNTSVEEHLNSPKPIWVGIVIRQPPAST